VAEGPAGPGQGVGAGHRERADRDAGRVRAFDHGRHGPVCSHRGPSPRPRSRWRNRVRPASPAPVAPPVRGLCPGFRSGRRDGHGPRIGSGGPGASSIDVSWDLEFDVDGDAILPILRPDARSHGIHPVRAVLPVRADDPFQVRDASSGLTISVRLADALDTPGVPSGATSSTLTCSPTEPTRSSASSPKDSRTGSSSRRRPRCPLWPTRSRSAKAWRDSASWPTPRVPRRRRGAAPEGSATLPGGFPRNPPPGVPLGRGLRRPDPAGGTLGRPVLPPGRRHVHARGRLGRRRRGLAGDPGSRLEVHGHDDLPAL